MKTKRQHGALANRQIDAAAKRLDEALTLLSEAIHNVNEAGQSVDHIRHIYSKVQTQLHFLRTA